MVNLDHILHTYLFQHCPATGMQNDDEAPLSIISAGGGLLVNKASEYGYDQEILQSHTADQPTAP